MDAKLNYKIAPYPDEYPPDEPLRRCPDLSHAKNNISYVPNINLETGLFKHLTWAKEFIKID